MAVSVEASWEEVLSSIDNLLMETEIQDSNPELGFHEAALLLNRHEMAVSILRALVEMDLDLDRYVYQVLRQLCSFLTDVYQYLHAKVSQIKRRTVTLPNLGLREMVHSGLRVQRDRIRRSPTRVDPEKVVSKSSLNFAQLNKWIVRDKCFKISHFPRMHHRGQ